MENPNFFIRTVRKTTELFKPKQPTEPEPTLEQKMKALYPDTIKLPESMVKKLENDKDRISKTSPEQNYTRGFYPSQRSASDAERIKKIKEDLGIKKDYPII